MTKSYIHNAALALGVNDREVASVEDSPAGDVITTTDGVRYVVVPEDNPDGNEAHGVMFLVPPVIPYHGTFPVYRQPVDVDILDADEVENVVITAPADPDAGDPDAGGDEDPPEGPAADVMIWVDGDPARAAAALLVEEGRAKPRSSLVKLLQDIVITAPPLPPADPDADDPDGIE